LLPLSLKLNFNIVLQKARPCRENICVHVPFSLFLFASVCLLHIFYFQIFNSRIHSFPSHSFLLVSVPLSSFSSRLFLFSMSPRLFLSPVFHSMEKELRVWMEAESRLDGSGDGRAMGTRRIPREGLWEIGKAVKCLEAICQSNVSFFACLHIKINGCCYCTSLYSRECYASQF